MNAVIEIDGATIPTNVSKDQLRAVHDIVRKRVPVELKTKHYFAAGCIAVRG